MWSQLGPLNGRRQSFSRSQVSAVREAVNSQRYQGGEANMRIDTKRERRTNPANLVGGGGWQKEILRGDGNGGSGPQHCDGRPRISRCVTCHALAVDFRPGLTAPHPPARWVTVGKVRTTAQSQSPSFLSPPSFFTKNPILRFLMGPTSRLKSDRMSSR